MIPAPFSVFQSKNVHDYKPIFEGLVNDFGYIYYKTILKWCGILDDDKGENKYWQVYLIRWEDKTVGICGLYSLYEFRTDELWLGWFGVIPEMRNLNIGKYALDWMKENAKSIGCKKIKSYIDKSQKPLPFYEKNGFHLVSTVGEYLERHTELTLDSFEIEEDFVIEFKMD